MGVGVGFPQGGYLRDMLSIGIDVVVHEVAEDDLADRSTIRARQEVIDSSQSGVSCTGGGIAVDASGDGRERNSLEAVLDREIERGAIAAAEKRLVTLVASEDRSDGVDDLLAWQVVGVGDLRRASEAAA